MYTQQNNIDISTYCSDGASDRLNQDLFIPFFQAKSLCLKHPFSETIGNAGYRDGNKTENYYSLFTNNLPRGISVSEEYKKGVDHPEELVLTFYISEGFICDLNIKTKEFTKKIQDDYMNVLESFSEKIIRRDKTVLSNNSEAGCLITKEGAEGSGAVIVSFEDYGMDPLSEYWQQYAFGQALVKYLNSQDASIQYQVSNDSEFSMVIAIKGDTTE